MNALLHPQTKQIQAAHARASRQQVDLRLTQGDIDHLASFVNNAAFYIEDLEEEIGEDLHDFWRDRESALRILTDWMLQASYTIIDEDEKYANT